jgi:hypothetical protein
MGRQDSTIGCASTMFKPTTTDRTSVSGSSKFTRATVCVFSLDLGKPSAQLVFFHSNLGTRIFLDWISSGRNRASSGTSSYAILGFVFFGSRWVTLTLKTASKHTAYAPQRTDGPSCNASLLLFQSTAKAPFSRSKRAVNSCLATKGNERGERAISSGHKEKHPPSLNYCTGIHRFSLSFLPGLVLIQLSFVSFAMI